MPCFESRDISVLVDMAGCPNRCRHCWLGYPPNKSLSEKIFRWVVQQFREWARPGEYEPFASPLTALTWYREPDFAPNYRELYDLEKEINGGTTPRFELLSIWRLARDESYVTWAYDIGTRICQISFFGMEKTTDYFYRRKGAFRDCITATQRLLSAGIAPRWQLFLTEPILPELGDLIRLVESMNLEEHVSRIGGEFCIFIHTPGPDGEAWNIEHLRPSVNIISQIPDYLVEKTKRHFGITTIEEAIGYAENDLLPEILCDPKPYSYMPDRLAFMVNSDLDVYSNIAEPMPWWRLGNLGIDGISAIMRRFENDELPGMQANFHIPVSELAKMYGEKGSRKIYKPGDLKSRLIRQWSQRKV